MKFSPKAWANMASLLVMVPYIVAVIGYRDALSQRASAYLALGSFLVGTLVYQWVYHRHAALLPASALPRAELSLTQERMPQVVWLALVPPVLVMAVLWWVTMYGSGLPWRDTWLGPPAPALSHRMYPMMATAVIVFNSVMSWKVVYSLARWHGMARTYPYRRERLLAAVAGQWLALVVSIAWASGNIFYMPATLATTCALVTGTGLFAGLWMAGREERLRKEGPATGSWCYFDLRDPTFFGPRGLNLANGWSWVLGAAGIAPILLAEWLFHQGRLGE